MKFASYLFCLILSISCVSSEKRQGLEITWVNLGKIDSHYIKSSSDALRNYFKVDTLIFVEAELPEETYYQPRNRYRADKLIRHLRDTYSTQKVVGLTSKDISTTSGEQEDWGIMGLAFRPGKSCVISTFRTFRGARNEEHKKERLNKVVIHEFGHTLGLPHCENSECVMRDAQGKVATVDQVNDFCTSCKSRIEKYLQN
jgi:archaemetzincin